MPVLQTLVVGQKTTVDAGPQDVFNDTTSNLLNGPQWNPADATSASIVKLSVAPGVDSETCDVTGVAPGVATINISCQKPSTGAAVVTPFQIQVQAAEIDHFNPTATPPVAAS